MSALVQWLIQTSWTLCLLIPLSWMLSLVLRRYCGARLAYAAWLLPLVTLVPEGWRPLAPIELGDLFVGPGAAAESTLVIPTAHVMDWSAMAFAIWALGASVLLAWSMYRQLRFRHQLNALSVPDSAAANDAGHWWPRFLPVVVSSACRTPMLVGVCPPQLVLPADRDRIDPMILEHERAHLRHGDPIWNLVSQVFRILFWFHPLVHLAVARLRRDQELAADESVTRSLRPDQRVKYGQLLLEAGYCAIPPLNTSWKSCHPTKERVMNIVRSPRPGTARNVGLGLLLTGLLTACALAPQHDAGDQAAMTSSDWPEDAPRPVERTPPRYPRRAFEEGITGYVTMDGVVQDDGSLSQIEVFEAEPQGVFESEALAAFSQWRFEPPCAEDCPRAVRQTIHFELGAPD